MLVVAGALITGASASDDLFSPAQSAATQPVVAATDAPESAAASDNPQSSNPQSGNPGSDVPKTDDQRTDDQRTDDSASPPSRALDRRDRIFYPGDTERPKPLFRKLFLNIVYDQADIFTSPFRVNRHNALEWLVPMAATRQLIASGNNIANAFENGRGQGRRGGRLSNIRPAYALIPIVAASHVYGAWRDSPKGREIGVLGTEALLDSLIVVGVLEAVFPANRPHQKNPLHLLRLG